MTAENHQNSFFHPFFIFLFLVFFILLLEENQITETKLKCDASARKMKNETWWLLYNSAISQLTVSLPKIKRKSTDFNDLLAIHLT